MAPEGASRLLRPGAGLNLIRRALVFSRAAQILLNRIFNQILNGRARAHGLRHLL